MPAVAVTDHGSLGGAVQFYTAATKAGIKPIIGIELYVAADRRARGGVKERFAHLTLLARDLEGYRNLVKLSTRAFLEGYYYKPRADWELLAEHCDRPHLPDRLHERPRLAAPARGQRRRGRGRGPPARRPLRRRERLRRAAGRRAARAARAAPAAGGARASASASRPWPPTTSTTCATRTPTPTTPCSASRRRATSPTRTACATAATSSTSSRPTRCASVSPSTREACDATLEIAERCDVTLEFGGYLLPHYPVPDGRDRGDATCASSASRASCAATAPSPVAEVRERLDYELGVIGEMGFDAYFLIVWDFVKFAKDSGIAVGPGRGSAAGSIVSYALGITDIDPLKYDLLFERFLNPGRKSMPDVDTDFSVARREEVIDYVAAQVRARPRGADHHLRHHGGARRDARRRPGHGPAVRRRRQDRQDDPRAGAAGDLRAGHAPRRRAAPGLRRATRRSRRSSTWR